jgi:hypothetical protein
MSEFVVTSELIPPKGVDLEPLFEKAEAPKPGGDSLQSD